MRSNWSVPLCSVLTHPSQIMAPSFCSASSISGIYHRPAVLPVNPTSHVTQRHCERIFMWTRIMLNMWHVTATVHWCPSKRFTHTKQNKGRELSLRAETWAWDPSSVNQELSPQNLQKFCRTLVFKPDLSTWPWEYTPAHRDRHRGRPESAWRHIKLQRCMDNERQLKRRSEQKWRGISSYGGLTCD